MEESLSHNMCYTPGIFDNIIRWHFVLEIDISMIFRGHMHIVITHCYYGQFKENYPFSFYLSKAVFLIFWYFIAANNSVLLLYACTHEISLKYLFPEQILSFSMWLYYFCKTSAGVSAFLTNNAIVL
jgi:hypothetical protein